MCFQLKLIRKEIYLSFLLCILLFASIDLLFYNYIVLGREEDDNNDVDDVREKEENKDEEDIEDNSINELFDNDNNNNDELFDSNNNDNRDSKDGRIEKEDIEDNVPFILPFNAVPFP
jgi:hypothetical protein